MRLHLNFGILGADGMPLSFAEVQAKARLIEDAGFSGIWSGHHIPVPGDTARTLPDPLPGLLIAASATSRVELGTCIYCLGLVNAGNFAQSAYTLEAFAPGRLTFGVGTGSQKQEWDIAGLDWSQRFTRLEESMRFVKSMFTGESSIEVEELTFGDNHKKYARQRPPELGEPTLAQKIGSPRFLLGTWRSPRQLRRAATDLRRVAGVGRAGDAGRRLEEGVHRLDEHLPRRRRDAGPGVHHAPRSRGGDEAAARPTAPSSSSAAPGRSPNGWGSWMTSASTTSSSARGTASGPRAASSPRSCWPSCARCTRSTRPTPGRRPHDAARIRPSLDRSANV